MTTLDHFDTAGLKILTRAECLRLLGSVSVGRLVYTDGALPVVRLVNFVVDANTVVFASADGDKLRAAERGDVVAFEADAVDLDRHLGWTVTAVGHLSVVPSDETEQLAREIRLRSWAPLRNPRLIRLGIESVTGRRLVPWAQRPHD
ncbi:pyridoxamine 5'-phosphate oxidase-like protein [Kribbella steppae]|uniref:Pyridoxamine 5'-phosphate oxidase-like protein n=1 Tax=Kribbella steppae TaxID=2512223 RepID=A0A4R2H3Z8_9ACTN|nr:pyridoxamine 5'-phosphate oxidase family protein [Kribbella steppae]TCO20324.1 pyridoxamine 5'-phosphate oxidase-like protein [Kribbella steppae]